MSAHRYRNPWHSPGNAAYGPAFYENNGRVVLEHRGVSVIRVWDTRYDYVFAGCCLTQRAGCSDVEKAKGIIDGLLDGSDPFLSPAVAEHISANVAQPA